MKILIVFGTRPEAIKMAPLVLKLKADARFKTRVCVTGQHKEMLNQVLQAFDIKPDYRLDVMRPNQTLQSMTSEILSKVDDVLIDFMPDMILVHGDTTTTMATSLAAYYRKISVGHIEAGLRTKNIYSPWPEEGNRKIVGALAAQHFAPTKWAKSNLLKEGVPEAFIHVTGNTVIDALKMTINRLSEDVKLAAKIESELNVNLKRNIILITGHRRENFGEGFNNICDAIKISSIKNPDYLYIYPVHLNPQVREPVLNKLANLDNVLLKEPLDYLPFVYLMSKSKIILTDSGGIQEEAPSLGKPVLLMRETTERPEAVKEANVKMVGTDIKKIASAIDELIQNKDKYEDMSRISHAYGDGNAAGKIIEILASLNNV